MANFAVEKPINNYNLGSVISPSR